MASGKRILGALVKWSLVLVAGAALGGYIVFTYHNGPQSPSLKPDDSSEVTPGSDSRNPARAASQPDSSSSEGSNSTSASNSNDTSGAVSSPPGQLGPEIEIEVKPVHEPLPPRRYHTKKKPDPNAKAKSGAKPPDVVPPVVETTASTTGGDTGGGTDGGDTGGGTDGGGDTGGTTGG